MAIFDAFNIRLPGEKGGRRPVSRAEAEDYSASLGLRPGGPGWGDAIRDYVRNGPVGSAHGALASPPVRPFLTQSANQVGPFRPGAPPEFGLKSAFPADLPLRNEPLAPRPDDLGMPPAVTVARRSLPLRSSPAPRRRATPAQAPTALKRHRPPQWPDEHRLAVYSLTLPPSEWDKGRGDGSFASRVQESREQMLDHLGLHEGSKPAPARTSIHANGLSDTLAEPKPRGMMRETRWVALRSARSNSCREHSLKIIERRFPPQRKPGRRS